MTRPAARRPSRKRPTPRWLLPALLFAVSLSWGGAQTFDANRYYQQCLRFEVGGDYETARQSCLTALQVEPDMVEAALALARIDLTLGNVGDAERRLLELRNRSRSAEPLLLLADIAIRDGRYDAATSWLAEARRRLAGGLDSSLNSRLEHLSGRLAERRGNMDEALAHYRQAIADDGFDVRYRLDEAALRLRLGDPQGAREVLQSYLQVSGEPGGAELRALLGRALWADGELGAAAREYETALSLRRGRDTAAQANDLRALTLIYYGQGDARSGGLALRDALRRGNLLPALLSNTLLWLLLLLVLLGVHLVGESRITDSTSLEVVEGPQLWTVGQLYGVLSGALASALLASVTYGIVVFGNILAWFTPLQGNEVRAVFFITLSLVLVALSVQRVRRNGWDPLERLLGSGEGLPLGIGVGLLLLAAVLAYLAYAPLGSWLEPFYLDLLQLTPLTVAAMVLLPLSELAFRGFAFPALAARYGPSMALIVAGGLSALVFAAPVLLLIAFGLALSMLFRRSRSGLVPLTAQITLHLGLVLAVAFSPWVRALFL